MPYWELKMYNVFTYIRSGTCTVKFVNVTITQQFCVVTVAIGYNEIILNQPPPLHTYSRTTTPKTNWLEQRWLIGVHLSTYVSSLNE